MACCVHVVEHWVLCLAILSVTPGNCEERKRRGRYTHHMSGFEVLIPRKVDASGFFLSFDVPHFYDLKEVRARRSASETQIHIRYALPFGGRENVVELWPNHGFLAPGFVSERRRRDLWGRNGMEYAHHKQCYFVGRVRGHPYSRAALSACDGLAGYVTTADGQYFVEPVADALPDVDGRHLHVVFRQELGERNRSRRQDSGPPTCGVEEDWRTAWQKRFEWELKTSPDFLMNISKSQESALAPRFLKTLVVVDKKFINYHRDNDVETYILTLMNEVSDYYHDGSLGHPLDVVIVRIMYLDKEEEELDLTIGPDAVKTMNSFKGWAQRVNPADTSHPNHHNIAVLITRYDICSVDSSNCNILGMASVTSVCQPERAVCINKDSGLLTGITIAHEIGHILGCPHDKKVNERDTGCEPFAPDGSAYVMSLFLKPRTSIWSECSRRCVQALIDTGMADCLLDEPQAHPFKFPEMPPGVMYDADYQCRDLLGSREVCSSKKDEMCSLLWCKTGPNSCAAPGRPAADGTKCSEGHWCFGGQCVMIGSRPAAVNGEWGAWGPWSSCSRSCGGGIKRSERFCDNPAPRNKGLYCIGDRFRYEVCNHVACDPSEPSFREVQCAAFNNKPFEGELYEWTPFKELMGRECELLCYSGVDFFASLSPVTKDGTPCQSGARDMCVAGECMHVGCDWVLGSEIEEDICGECRGDGTHCHRNEIIFNKRHGNRYVKIGTVPTDSRNIKIEELKPSINTIAVSNKDGTLFFLNGNYSEYSSGEFLLGKNVYGIYSHPESEREVLTIKGPTSEDLSVYAVFYGGENPGVRISFYEHKIVGKLRKPSFKWEFLEWGLCSSRCGGGSQIAEASCAESNSGKVSAFYCEQSTRPKVRSRMCNQRKCFVGWHMGPWGPCSGRVWGLQRRKVECRAENPTWRGEPVLVDNSECRGVRPPDTRSCPKSVAKAAFRSTTHRDSTSFDSMRTFAMETNVYSPRSLESVGYTVYQSSTPYYTFSTGYFKGSSTGSHYPSKVHLGVRRLTSSDMNEFRTSGTVEHLTTKKLHSTPEHEVNLSTRRKMKSPESHAAEHFWTFGFGIHERITGNFDQLASVSRQQSTPLHSKHPTTDRRKHKRTANRRFKRSTTEQLKYSSGHRKRVTSRYRPFTSERTSCVTTELPSLKYGISTKYFGEKSEDSENATDEYNNVDTTKYVTPDFLINNEKEVECTSQSDESAEFVFDSFDFKVSSTVIATDFENDVTHRFPRANHDFRDTLRFSSFDNLSESENYLNLTSSTSYGQRRDPRTTFQQSEFVVDSVPESRIVLKEAPLIGTMCNKTLSEVAQQEMGETLGDTLDTVHGKIYRGKEALDREREIKKRQEKEDMNNL